MRAVSGGLSTWPGLAAGLVSLLPVVGLLSALSGIGVAVTGIGVAVLLTGCSDSMPSDPPSVREFRPSPPEEPPPPPPGTRDDELSYLPVPLSVEDARLVLTEATVYAPWGVGRDELRERGRPMQALAITVLQRQADAAGEFEAVFARASAAPGKVLALCGLRAVDDMRFERLARGLTTSTTPVADVRFEDCVPGCGTTLGHAVTEIREGKECLEISRSADKLAAAFADTRTQIVWTWGWGRTVECVGRRDLQIEVLRNGASVFRSSMTLCQAPRGTPAMPMISIDESRGGDARDVGAPRIAGTIQMAGESPHGLPLRVSLRDGAAAARERREVTFEASTYDVSTAALGGGLEIRTTPVERRPLPRPGEDDARWVFSPSGQYRARIVEGGDAPRVDVLDVRGTTDSFDLTPASSVPYEVVAARWSEDSRHLVFTAVNSEGHQPWRVLAVVYSTSARRFFQLDETCQGVVAEPRFSLAPDGLLAATLWRTPADETRQAAIRLDELAEQCRPSSRALERGAVGPEP